MAITNYLPKTRQLVDRLIDFLKARPTIYNKVLRIAQAHDRWMDYRKFGTTPQTIFLMFTTAGLMRDDLLPSENPVVQEALTRISEKDAFDRTFRLRRAVQLYMTHSDLPVHEQIPEEQVLALTV